MTDKLIIFDTTLRDGEQSPGASMTKDEKLRIARQLERLRVDVIEAGFAASSNGDFEGVQAIADAVKDSTVCSLARANDRDISRAAEALKGGGAGAHPHLHRDQRPAHGEEAAHDARAGVRAGAAVGALCAQAVRRRRVLARGRLPLRPRLPVPRARGGDRRGRDHDQHPRHRGLCGARAVRRLHPQPARAHSQLRQGGVVGALPQRPRHGGGQFAGRRDDRRRAPGRVHDQRPGRACRQLLARRGGDGGEDAARLLRPGAAASTRRRSCRPRAWWPRPPASSCSRTRRWSAPTPSRTPRASTRTAC